MILERNTFRGKAVLVAGAGGGGIGTATCLALAAAGAKIIAVDLSESALTKLDSQLTDLGAEFETHVLDARDDDSVVRLMAGLDDSLPGLPYLVNVIGGIRGSDWCDLEQTDETQLSEVLDLNVHCAFRLGRRVAERLIRSDSVVRLMAGLDDSLPGLPYLVNVIGGIRGSDWCDLEQTDETQLSEVLDLNVHCAFRLGRRVAERLIRSGQPGSIVNVSSISAFFATEQLGLYAIAKSALEGMTRAMAVSWARHGIRANAVAPGRVDTPMILESVRKGIMPGSESYSHKIPMQRTATPQEIAAPIVFLLSDLASYITGQSLLVDGGASVRFMVQPD